jgi:hypothetical protein
LSGARDSLAFSELPELQADLHQREGHSMPPKFAKLAGLGAFGAIVFFVALYALVVKITFPGRSSGIDGTQSIVTWIALGIVILALAALHVAIGRQLLSIGRGRGRTRV